MLVEKSYKIAKPKLLKLLDKLDALDEPSISIYFPSDTSEKDVLKAIATVPGNEQIAPRVVKEVTTSKNGAVLFWGESSRYLILPPFALTEQTIIFGHNTGPLRELLAKEYVIAVVLVRLGRYGIGLFRGDRLATSKVGTGLVHARHSKGGSSSHRFERHREKQIEYYFTDVCIRVREKLEPFVREIDYLFYGGEENTIREFSNWCHFLNVLKSRTVDTLLNVREPKQKSLEDSINLVWSSKVVHWSMDGAVE
jgi:hypothetical protein